MSADYNYCLCPILTPTPTAPCPTQSPLSNGRISYDATTNIATYSCNTGYTTSGATTITCQSDGTSLGTWSPPPTVTCAREYCTDYIAMHPNRSAKYKMFYCNQALLSYGITFCWRLGRKETLKLHTIHLLQPRETATITLRCIAKHHSKQQTIFSCSICAPLEIIVNLCGCN